MAFFNARPQSSAIKIVKPGEANDDDNILKPTPVRKTDNVQRHCRNIMIYGSCKYENKGCVYYHPPAPDTSPNPSNAPRAESPIKGQTISSPSPSLSAKAVNAPVFVPKLPLPALLQPTATPPPQSPSPPTNGYQEDHSDFSDAEGQAQELNDQYYPDHQYDTYGAGEQHYYAAPVFVRQPLNYHLYTSTVPAAFVSSVADTHFIPPSGELRTLLQSRSEDLRMAPPSGLGLPEEMQGYHSLIPLENIGGPTERRKFGNWNSSMYRAINSVDGCTYALRRIENYRLSHQAAFSAIETWAAIRHPGVVAIHEAFTTHAFGDSSLVVAYTYHPQAQTLFDAHLKLTPPAYQPGMRFQQPAASTQVPERTLWSYIVQIAGAIKRVHDAGQALRMIDVTKVLVTSKNHVRVGSCGIVDVLLYDTPQDMHMLQQEDMTMFGRLVFALCTGNVMASSGGNFQKSLEVMGRLYSPEIKTVALFLVNKGGPHKNIGQLLEIISSRVVAEMGDALIAADTLQNELMGELENARLVRLLCKFGFINERPEFAREPRWSETGDRYIIKLFRDYVFHQVDENGNPSLNLSHVLTCLSKLDSGTDEKVMLVSRDEQSCLVVSYKEIKACVESAFGELARAAASNVNNNVGAGYQDERLGGWIK